MNGIEKITQKIQADTQADIMLIQGDAQNQVAQIQRDVAAEIATLRGEILTKGQQRADERGARLRSAAQMEAKKLELSAKQEMIDRAFDGAVQSLCGLEEKAAIALLAGLAVKASSTGCESIIFSQKDRAQIGKQVVMTANESISAGTGLTLSQETRDISGGFILSDGDVEVNCAFETLVRLQRDALEGEVAAMLFQ